MRKIAVYGGSFDPPHKGHRLLAESLAKKTGADKVVVIPAALSPFKNKTSASPEQRLDMCSLAFNSPLFEISDMEIKRGGKSYTVDTLRDMKKNYPDAQLYLFMGEDMLLSFDKWYNYREILKIATVVCACRTENREQLAQMHSFCENVLKNENGRVIISESVPIEISSSEIRGMEHSEMKKYLDSDVYDYIITRGLYRFDG